MVYDTNDVFGMLLYNLLNKPFNIVSFNKLIKEEKKIVINKKKV